ncbi:MAG: hypothetical protein ACRDMA_07425 [Solirubrobacterales bacterium]
MGSGFNETWGNAEPHLDRVAQAGGLLRISISWMKTRDGDWSGPDAAYRTMLAHGVRPLFILQGPTMPSRAVWSEFVREATRRYPGAAAFEIWNEPNLAAFWGGHPSPAKYVRLFRAAAASAAPEARLLVGGLSPRLTSENDAIGWRAYLRHLRCSGVTAIADGISYHVYVGLHRLYPDVDRSSPLRLVKRGRRIAGNPVAWITELSVAATGDGQVRRTRRAVRSALSSGPEAILMHRLIDDGPHHHPYWRHAGMLDSHGRPKPAWTGLLNGLRRWGPVYRPLAPERDRAKKRPASGRPCSNARYRALP